jgi:hypothetical protein
MSEEATVAKAPDGGMLRPNELSVPLVPNRLSVLEGQRVGEIAEPQLAPGARRGRDARRGQTPQASGQGRGRPRVSVSALLTLAAFAVILVSRVADFGPSSAPGGDNGGSPAMPSASEVIFGTAAGSDCTVTGRANVFAAGDKVWWTGAFAEPLEAGDRVSWRVLRSGAIVLERVGPTDTPTERWDTLCGSEPMSFGETGTYRFEMHDFRTGSLLASGTFTLR